MYIRLVTNMENRVLTFTGNTNLCGEFWVLGVEYQLEFRQICSMYHCIVIFVISVLMKSEGLYEASQHIWKHIVFSTIYTHI